MKLQTPLALALLPLAVAFGAEGWLSRAPLPTPRQEVAVAEAGGKVYVIGGILASRAPTDRVERYDPLRDAWEETAPLPARLHHLGAAVLEGTIYVVGGLDTSFNGVSSTFAYQPASNRWEPRAALPTARGAMAVAALGGKVYAAGGQRGGLTVREFAAFTPGPGGGSWEVLPEMPTARNHLAGAAARGLFFAIAGRTGAGVLRPEVERFDPSTRLWSPAAPIPTPRAGLALAAIGERFYLFGGEGNRALPSGVFPQTEVYDAALDAWFPRREMPLPRHGIGAAALRGVIWIPGGAEVEGFGVTAANAAYLPPAEDLPPEDFLRGDANGDGGIDLSDPIAILFALFGGSALPCPDAADADDDGRLDLTDAVRLLEHLFLEGPPPPPPGPGPGPDPTPDGLGCSY